MNIWTKTIGPGIENRLQVKYITVQQNRTNLGNEEMP